MYNLIEYSDIDSKTSSSLWKSYKDGSNNNLVESESCKSKVKKTLLLMVIQNMLK